MIVTATDRVRAEIENRIVDGSLSPGAPLDEAQLSEFFAVSRTPVREALLQLSALGFVRIVPRSGIYVVQLSAQDLAAMFETLAFAESACAKLVVHRISAAQLKALCQLHKNGRKAVASGDLDAYFDYNKAFHESFYNSCGNAYLVEQILLTRKHTNPYRQHIADYAERISQSWIEHDKMLTAVLEKDEAGAMDEAARHIVSAGQGDSQLAAPKSQQLKFQAQAKNGRTRNIVDMPRLYKSDIGLH